MRLVKTIVLHLIGAALRGIVCDVPPPPPPPPPKLPTEAEIDARLQAYAESRGMAHLNFKESIADLLQLLDIRNDFGSRASLWVDLGHADAYQGSAEQNILMLSEVRHLWAMGDI